MISAPNVARLTGLVGEPLKAFLLEGIQDARAKSRANHIDTHKLAHLERI